jgi:A/G-specific adenine glycosylase
MKPVFARKLLKWNQHKNKRQMPWKGVKDPYKIWLSEIILQQTRVEQGWAYYEKFIKTFSSIKHLAKATDEKVFKLWEGLGYYSRCKNLLATARIVVKDHKGIFPSEYEKIKNLKGIGPYTAAAIASFAFNKPYAVVDGNVQRILARYFGITTPVDTSAGKKLFNQLAQALLDKDNPAIYNQAIMDFGATICKPQNPLCTICVQRNECVAYNLDQVKALPVKEKAIVKKERWFYYYLFVLNKQVYVKKRTAKDIWQNLHEFVLEETDKSQDTGVAQSAFFKKLIGKQSFTVIAASKIYRQQLSHQYINGQFVIINLKKPLPGLKGYLLIENKKIKRLAFPGLINQYLQSSPEFLSM